MPAQKDHEKTRAMRRGIYLLPNLLTTAALFAGFYAIVAAIDGNFKRAGIAVFIAMIMDGMDGRVARLTSTESDFGKEYDSLADMVSFGLAPAIVVYQWGVARIAEYSVTWGRIGWLAAFFYAVAAAMRLARFNARVGIADKRYFEGLPSPSAAALVASVVWVGTEYGVSGLTALIFGFFVTATAGALMVSGFKYYSFKEFNFRKVVPFGYLALIPLVFMVVALSPPEILFTLFALYSLSGPVWSTWRGIRRRRRRADAGGSRDDTK